jgi:hypothetical protein
MPKEILGRTGESVTDRQVVGKGRRESFAGAPGINRKVEKDWPKRPMVGARQ